VDVVTAAVQSCCILKVLLPFGTILTSCGDHHMGHHAISAVHCAGKKPGNKQTDHDDLQAIKLTAGTKHTAKPACANCVRRASGSSSLDVPLASAAAHVTAHCSLLTFNCLSIAP
jgi:hypothetical protein